MGLRLLPSGVSTVPDAVWTAIAAADAKAANARGMVLARDAKLDQASTDASAAKAETVTLAQLAATLGAAIPASEAVHAAINARIDAIQLTKGDKGDPGVAGTANLALGAAPVGLVGLGGNTAVTIPLSRTMPNTTYTVQLAHSAVVSLASVTFSNIVKTTATVTVKVTGNGVAIAAGTLIAVAY